MILLTFFLISWKMLSIFAVMNLIGRHIEYLIRYNDCVIVPGWGAFIANTQSAVLNEHNVLMPPTRSLGFNPSLIHDDGLLASSIVRKTGVTYDVAIKQIAEAVNSLNHQLKLQGEIAISNIGVFTKKSNDALLFEPFAKTSAATSFMGLPKARLVPILAHSKVEDEKPISKKDTIYVPIRRSWTRIAASVAVVLGLGFVFSTPIVNDDANLASLSTPTISAPEKVQIKLNEPTGNEELILNVSNVDSTESMVVVDTIARLRHQKIVAYKKMREERRQARRELMKKRLEEYQLKKELARNLSKASLAVDQNNAKSTSPAIENSCNEEVRLSTADQYCLIIASLPNRALAEEYIEKSKNKRLEILEKDGRFRIYAATGESSKAILANAKKTGLMQRYPNAWVCRK